MTDNSPPLLPVSEAAREAAKEIFKHLFGVDTDDDPNVRFYLSGAADDGPFLQTLARLQSPPAASQDGAKVEGVMRTAVISSTEHCYDLGSQDGAGMREALAEKDAEIAILADIARSYREMLERRDGASLLDFRADDQALEGLRRLAALPTFREAALTHQGELQQGSDFYANLYAQRCGRVLQLETALREMLEMRDAHLLGNVHPKGEFQVVAGAREALSVSIDRKGDDVSDGK